MADDTRHAAWWLDKRFSVRLLPEEGEPTELVGGLAEFLDAVDFAVEWLAREDPQRTGSAGLAIFETQAGEDEQVWAYPPEGLSDDEPLLKIFGFDPVNWRPASKFATREPSNGTFFQRAPDVPDPAPLRIVREPLSLPVPPPVPTPTVQEHPPAAEPVRQPAPTRPAFDPEDEPAREQERPHIRPRRALAAAWEDPIARSFLFLGAVSLWLALAFSNATLLMFVLVALSGLWWRRDKLIDSARTDIDDWA